MLSVLYEIAVMAVFVCGFEAVIYASLADKPDLHILGEGAMIIAYILELIVLW